MATTKMTTTQVKTRKQKVWLITGCSTGFGRLLSEAVLKRGDQVLVTSRQTKDVQDIVKKFPELARSARLDVTDKSSIAQALKLALKAFGRIDVLVNNAGFGFEGAFEELSDQQIRKEFDTNYFGVLDVTRAILPTLRKQKSGHILNFSSIVGRMSFQTMGTYCSSKFAIEGFSESLAGELKDFGIKLTLIEPGAYNTDFAHRSLATAKQRPEYKALHRSMNQDRSNNKNGDLDPAIQAMIAVVELANPPLRMPLGFGTLPRIVKKLNADIAAYNSIKRLWKTTDSVELGLGTKIHRKILKPAAKHARDVGRKVS